MALRGAEPFIPANAQPVYFHGPHTHKIKSILLAEAASSDESVCPVPHPVASTGLARCCTD